MELLQSRVSRLRPRLPFQDRFSSLSTTNSEDRYEPKTFAPLAETTTVSAVQSAPFSLVRPYCRRIHNDLCSGGYRPCRGAVTRRDRSPLSVKGGYASGRASDRSGVSRRSSAASREYACLRHDRPTPPCQQRHPYGCF